MTPRTWSDANDDAENLERRDSDLKTIKLSAKKVKKVRVATVNIGMNKRRSNSLSSSIVKSISDSAKISNGEEARFRHR